MGWPRRLRDQPTWALTGPRSKRIDERITVATERDTSGTGGGADPSMEDILASIRRILSEEDLPEDKALAPDPVADQEPDVLLLDTSMLVADQPERHIPERSHTASHPIIARSAPPPPRPC